MQWRLLTRFSRLADGVPASGTPIDAASSSLISYIVSFGAIGVFALISAWLLLRGWRLVSPAEIESIRDAARKESRADLLAERDRLIIEKREIEQQRDEALRVARDQIVPLLNSFVTTTTTLVPILQTTTTLVPILQDIIREPPGRRVRGGADRDRG